MWDEITYPFQTLSTVIWPIVFDIEEKHIQQFQRKFGKDKGSKIIPPKSKQVMNMTRGI